MNKKDIKFLLPFAAMLLFSDGSAMKFEASKASQSLKDLKLNLVGNLKDTVSATLMAQDLAALCGKNFDRSRSTLKTVWDEVKGEIIDYTKIAAAQKGQNAERIQNTVMILLTKEYLNFGDLLTGDGPAEEQKGDVLKFFKALTAKGYKNGDLNNKIKAWEAQKNAQDVQKLNDDVQSLTEKVRGMNGNVVSEKGKRKLLKQANSLKDQLSAKQQNLESVDALIQLIGDLKVPQTKDEQVKALLSQYNDLKDRIRNPQGVEDGKRATTKVEIDAAVKALENSGLKEEQEVKILIGELKAKRDQIPADTEKDPNAQKIEAVKAKLADGVEIFGEAELGESDQWYDLEIGNQKCIGIVRDKKLFVAIKDTVDTGKGKNNPGVRFRTWEKQ